MKKLYSVVLLFTTFTLWSLDITKVSEFSYTDYCYANNIYISGDILAKSSIRGVDLYDINNMNLISRVNTDMQVDEVFICGDFLYISNIMDFHRVDISDPENPVFTHTLNLSSTGNSFTIDNKIYVTSNIGSFCVKVYDNNSFNFLYEFPSPNPAYSIWYLGGGIAFTFANNSEIILFDLNDPENIEILGSYQSDLLDTISFPVSGAIIDNTKLIISSGLSGMLFYDITDPSDWVLINHLDRNTKNFCINEDNELLGVIESHQLLLYDISEVENITLSSEISSSLDFYSYLIFYDNKLFAATVYGGFYIYDLVDEELELHEQINDTSTLNYMHIKDETLYLGTANNGITCWDITNPTAVDNLGSNFNDYFHYMDFSFNDKVVSCGINELGVSSQKLYELNNGNVDHILNIDESYPICPSQYGFFQIKQSVFYKYQLNENNELEVVAQIPLSNSEFGYVFFKDNLAYIVSNKLSVVKNIDSEDMEITSSQNLPQGYNASNIYFFQDYLFLSPYNSFNGSKLYNIANPESPYLLANLEKSGLIAIDEENELMFMGKLDCDIYDLSNIESGELESIYTFENWAHINELACYKVDGNNYLIYLEPTSCSIYDYGDFVDTEDIEIPQSDIYQLTNYPNPFNPSTTISFELNTELTENTELEIYNVKGQKIKSYPISSSTHSPITSITWDGRDYAKNQVSSGIYLTTLKSGDRTIASRKMMLLK